ncbi:MAG: hypothetical protein GX787_05610 [Tissierellia bacterium]|nr:hypothetical protein [Tissierellia bacterium]
MKILPINLIISLLLVMSIFAIVIFIQIKLSRSENKYLGLIMPTLSFLLSLMTILGMVSFIQLTSSSNGVVEVAKNNIEYLGIFFTFLVSNIPTIILGGIYYSERNKIKINKSIEKMKISDL